MSDENRPDEHPPRSKNMAEIRRLLEENKHLRAYNAALEHVLKALTADAELQAKTARSQWVTTLVVTACLFGTTVLAVLHR